MPQESACGMNIQYLIGVVLYYIEVVVVILLLQGTDITPGIVLYP